VATTAGLVQRMTWTAGFVCVQIGPTPSSVELLFLQFAAADSAVTLAFKKNLANLLVRAKTARYQVTVTHPNSSAEIQNATLLGFDISPVGNAVHGDFYCITGSGIPNGAEVVFDSATATIAVTPDLVRPHWVTIAALPGVIPTGYNTVRLQAPGWSTEAVPVLVTGGNPQVVRVLYSGKPKDRPYTIAFVGNPAIETTAGAFVADPVLTNRPDYHRVVAFCLRNLLTVTEDLLRRTAWDAQFRFVSIFDASLAAVAANALAHEFPPNLMETRRTQLKGFLARFDEIADLVLVVHGSTTHDRATAWFTTDDAAQPGVAYTYDAVARTHGRYASIPGSAALPLSMNQTGLTPLHEVGHAASDFNNGRVLDLYVDGVGGFAVNKKARALSTDPIPVVFANYNGTDVNSDQNRDALGYPANWTSYHPELIDPAHPNLMDNYWLAAGGNPQVCRLDRLTYAWFTDRLRAKLER
jgi:hypothetical protein